MHRKCVRFTVISVPFQHFSSFFWLALARRLDMRGSVAFSIQFNYRSFIFLDLTSLVLLRDPSHLFLTGTNQLGHFWLNTLLELQIIVAFIIYSLKLSILMNDLRFAEYTILKSQNALIDPEQIFAWVRIHYYNNEFNCCFVEYFFNNNFAPM